MGIVIIILVIIVVGISLFLLFKIIGWIVRKKVRIVWMFSFLGTLGIGMTINTLFFVKMEFIQSEVYPDLYIIKNPVKERSTLNNIIKEKVFRTISVENKKSNTLRFYEYHKGDFGESGTVYFIKNKERRDGMTAELLEYYPEYLIAEYSLQYCSEESAGYFGKLDYYNDRQIIKTDTLLNSCN